MKPDNFLQNGNGVHPTDILHNHILSDSSQSVKYKVIYRCPVPVTQANNTTRKHMKFKFNQINDNFLFIKTA